MEARDDYDFDDEVGRLIFCCTEQPTATPSRAILRSDQFDLGRKDIERILGINELTISTHHVRFRCVMYEDETDEQVAPMVYVRVLSVNPVQIIHTAAVLENNEHTLRKDDADFLLNHGDILQLTPKTSLLFSAGQSYLVDSSGLDIIQKAETAHFSDQFLVTDRKLGFGGQASVFVAVKQPVGRQVACKIVPLPHTKTAASTYFQKDKCVPKKERDAEMKNIERRLIHKRDKLAREFLILKDLSHPNIISLEKVICGTYNTYIIQELITGGDLLSYIDRKQELDEAESAVITRQLLKAVQYLHSNGVVHRDIKPENVLLTSSREGCRIVLTDFGHSRTIDDAKTARVKAVTRMQTEVGTHGYTAPEVFQRVKRDIQQRGYSKAVDIWSVGCVTATLLTNTLVCPSDDVGHVDAHPSGTTQGEQQRHLTVMDHDARWSKIGRKAKSFIKACLVLDETDRLTAKQALLHPWFTNKHYAVEMEAAYERAVQDWKPRPKSGNLVEFIDTSDAVSAASRPEYVEQLVEEVESRHFRDVPPTVPTMSKSDPKNTLAQRNRIRTPLPGIGEETSSDGVEVPASPSITQLHDLFASPLLDLRSTQLANAAANDSLGHFSIEDFGPPETQVTPPMVPNSPLLFIDSPTQSQ